MNQVQDDFSQYEVQPLVDDFAKYEVSVPEESTLGSIVRGGARVASRIGETIVGLPRDFRELAGGLGIKAAEAITGEEAKNTRDRFKNEKVLSSSSDIRKELAERTGGYTEPQNPREELSDEFFTDLALLALPVKGKIPFARALGTDIAGHLVKEGVAKFGAGETAQDLSKLGTFFLTGLITPGSTAKTFTDKLYKQRDALVPAGADVDATALRKGLEPLKIHLEKGVPGTKEKAVLGPIDTLLNKTVGGRIEIDELLAAKRQINEKIGEVISKEGIKPKDAKQAFKPLGRKIEEALELYGNQSNPEFLKLHKRANEAFGAIEESKKVTQFLNNKVPQGKKLVAGLLFESAALGVPATIKTAGGIGAAYGAAKGMELMLRINQSPVLRKYYLGVVKNSLSGNAAAVSKNLHALDQMLKKEEPEIYDELSVYLVK